MGERGSFMLYAGDISCKDCWETLRQDETAQLIDVRTFPEWNFVGVPALETIGKRLITIEWQQFPDMQVNANFTALVAEALEATGVDKQASIYCLCRSGVRSISAASALTQAGHSNAFNILGGFEGDKDSSGHRANIAGWKFDGLPWVQG